MDQLSRAEPAKPNTELAQLIFGIYREAGLNEPTKAVQALQLVVAARPKAPPTTPARRVRLQSEEPARGGPRLRKGRRAAPANHRTRVKKELEEVKKFPNGGKTYTTTTNGKTYALKKGKNGQFEGTEIPKTTTTSTAPTKTSTTTTTKK